MTERVRQRWLLAAMVLAYAAGLALLAVGRGHTVALGLRLAGDALLLVLVGLHWRNLTSMILAGMAVGVHIGVDAPAVALNLHFLSDIFLKLVKTIVAPLILVTLINGIAGHGDLKSVGRMGWKSLLYFEVLTTVALVLGLVAANLSHVGDGLVLPPDLRGDLNTIAPLHWQEFLVHVFPENLARSVAEGQVLQVAVFAVLFGLGLALVPREKAVPLLRLTESITEVMFRFTNIVMYLAPAAVLAAIAYTIARLGPGVLLNLGKLLGVFYVTAAVFVGGVLLPVVLLTRLPLRRFLKHVSGPAAIAFATATSEAALPRAMEEMEALGVPRRVVAFVIPAGYSFNLDGSTLYLSLAMMFVAQAAKVPLGIGQQIVMVATLMLASKGIAGVPRAVLVVLLATASTLHLPSEPILVLLGVDALMDMGRTAINVTGNCLASAVVAQWEGVFGSETPATVVLEQNVI